MQLNIYAAIKYLAIYIYIVDVFFLTRIKSL